MASPTKAAGAPVVTAVFRTPEQIESAYQAAVEHGYTIGDVNVVMSEDTRARLYKQQPEVVASEIGKKAAEGAELGGPTGGRVGIAITIGAALRGQGAPHALSLEILGVIGLARGLIEPGHVIDTAQNARSIEINLIQFTLIGATTRSGLLTAPLLSRFGIK